MKYSGPHANSPLFDQLGLGLGLRAPHFNTILETLPAVDWFEILTENYIGVAGVMGGRPWHVLEKVRSRYPIACHGVSLSIGSCDRLDFEYLKQIKTLFARVEPRWVSDHLCWTGIDGANLHDLLPLPYTEEALNHVVGRIEQVQDFLQRRLVIENVSSYLTYEHSHLTEWEFLAEVAERADCGLLLDINNVYVSSVNHNFEPRAFLDGIPVSRVAQFHLAGHSDCGHYLVDTHDHPVAEPVWELYGEAIRRFGPVSTLLERDDRIPELSELLDELAIARSIMERSLESRKAQSSRQPAMVVSPISPS
jgi:uncharacterized protein (UPF0276 family)